jgi:hypothetical protein
MIRYLNESEIKLIEFLICDTDVASRIGPELPTLLVEEMDDGNMGGVKAFSEHARRFGRELIQKDFFDSDGVPVLVSVYLDVNENFLELDLWKVDNTQLIKFPTAPDEARGP